MKRLILLSVLLLFFLGGCGYKTGVTQTSELGFVQFTGNWKNVLIQFDNSAPLELKYFSDPNNPNDPQSKPTLKYGLKPGKHTVKVTRNGKLLVKRLLLVTNQQTSEVAIP